VFKFVQKHKMLLNIKMLLLGA